MLRSQHRLSRPDYNQVLFSVLLLAVLGINLVPELRAGTLAFAANSAAVEVSETAEKISDDRVVIVGGGKASEVTLTGERKVALKHGDSVEYASTRPGETVSSLLARMGAAVEPLETVKVDLTGEEIEIEIAESFVYYETVTEAVAYTTIYTKSCRIPKGETQVVQAGQNGTRTVTYEVAFADGQTVSRQAVEESGNTSVPELAYIGVLVSEAQAGDTIAAVVPSSDGGGYLIMKSGDSLHYTGTKSVKCTAYTGGVGKVGFRTATGTAVRRGCVAVDKSVIPLGTKMFITTADGYTYGMAKAEDTGVRGNTVDLYMDSYNECIRFGRRSSTVYILD